MNDNYWDQYVDAYEDCFQHTSTSYAPWHIIPADYKPFTRLAVGYVIYKAMKGLKLNYPTVSSEERESLQIARVALEMELQKNGARPKNEAAKEPETVTASKAEKEPESKSTDSKKLDAKNSESKQSESKNPNPKKSESKKSELKKSEVKKSEAKKSEPKKQP